MRVIERSEFRDETGTISLPNRLRGTLRYGLAWYGIMQAQLEVTERLSRSLPNDYHLLRNVLVPDGNGGDVHLDYVLLTARGLVVLDIRDVRGNVFGSDQMKEWTVMARGRRATSKRRTGR